jgi:ribosome-binding factor A
MPSDRITRVNELLKREIASAIYRVVDNPDFDFAAVTVTKVRVNSDLRSARVFMSIRGDEAVRRHLLKQIRGHRRDFQEAVGKNVVLKYNPLLKFEMDGSVEQGDNVLKLISELDGQNPPEPEEPPDR